MKTSKRSLLKVGLAASVWPLWRQAEAADAYDAIVMGAGTAGMALAIFAAKRGGRVLILEKADIIGGTLPFSGGQIAAAGTAFQKAKGVSDTPDQHYADIMRISEKTANPDICRLFVDNAGATVNWLAENGYQVEEGQPRAATGHTDFSVARYHGSKGGGKGIYGAMEAQFQKAVQSGRITVKTSTGAIDVIQDAKGAVLGLIGEDDSGARTPFTGRSTVIAAGGCAANPRLFADLHSVPLYAQMGYQFSQGHGIMLGVAAGGTIWGRNEYICQFGTIMGDDNTPSYSEGGIASDPVRRPPWEIYVNALGERFVNEDEKDNGVREKALVRQLGHRFWTVFDQAALEKAPPLTRWEKDKYLAAFTSHPSFAKGASLRELAVKAGVDPQGLVKSVDAYNAALQGNRPDPMGRAHRPAPIAQGPFYAIRLQGFTPVSTAGLAIDGGLRVISPTGAPVPNLYAAGEVIGNWPTAGNTFVGGSMITPALTFGRLLGEKILPFGAA